MQLSCSVGTKLGGSLPEAGYVGTEHVNGVLEVLVDMHHLGEGQTIPEVDVELFPFRIVIDDILQCALLFHQTRFQDVGGILGGR